jgi:hypothetical protein
MLRHTQDKNTTIMTNEIRFAEWIERNLWWADEYDGNAPNLPEVNQSPVLVWSNDSASPQQWTTTKLFLYYESITGNDDEDNELIDRIKHLERIIDTDLRELFNEMHISMSINERNLEWIKFKAKRGIL